MVDQSSPVTDVQQAGPVAQETMYLIRKNGMFYRPNSQGYTCDAAYAGRFTLSEAIRHSHPNGPDGPRDGIDYMLADEPAAPVCPACDGTKIVSQGGHDTGCDACYGSPQTLPAPGEVEADYSEQALADKCIDFLEERADVWMADTVVQRMFNAMASVFEKYAPQEIMDQFREKLGVVGRQCHVEGALRVWEEIAAQQRAAGTPLAPFTDQALATVAAANDEGERSARMRQAIDAGLKAFCSDTSDFTMSSAMRRAAADFIMGEPGMFPLATSRSQHEGADNA